MKKHLYLLIIFVLGTTIISANPVTLAVAKNVAGNFIKQNSKIAVSSVTLAFTETSATGLPDYFVFNINANDGFVIVSADDAALSIIGYSTEDHFVMPVDGSNIFSWMQNRKNEIEYIRTNNLIADIEIAKQWTDYQNNQKTYTSTTNTMSVAALCQTKWDQSPYYNDLCPGGSVTGCVATAMAQIMRYWNYPTTGTGSSSYSSNYGTLTANYGATTYNWSNMPLTISSANNSVAVINSHCGISVEMDYSPNGSGAMVLSYGGNGACAENSYVDYFGYDPATVKGKERSNFSDSQWLTLIKNELDNGRPIQYDGFGSGGHTWVCDGYDANNKVHMNWGWGGYDDGYFSINGLNPGSSDFNDGCEMIIGIQPLASTPLDAGIAAVNSPSGAYCSTTFTPSVKIKNYGANTLTSCTINYNIDANSVQTQSWTGSLASGQSANVTLAPQTAAAGSHTLTCFTTNPNSGIDGKPINDQTVSSFNISISGAALPVIEGMEGSANLPLGWTKYNPDGDAAWKIVTTLAHTGTHCIGFNNCGGNGNSDMSGKKDRFYTETYNMSSGSFALTFDVAYTPTISQGGFYSDTLVVFASSDCGATWNEIYHKGGTVLATAPTYFQVSGCWHPTSSQWRTETVDLASLAGQPNVMLAFENRSGWGSWVYLDNINISSATGISSMNTDESLEIYPNPARNNITVKASQTISGIQIVNVLGQSVITIGRLNELSTQVDITSLPSGVYFIKVLSGDNQKSVKVIKQ